MKAYLIVVNGYDGIEDILGLCGTQEEALTRRTAIQAKCVEENAKMEAIRALPEDQQADAITDTLFDFGFIAPDQICVREVVDDGTKCTMNCVSDCKSYRFIG